MKRLMILGITMAVALALAGTASAQTSDDSAPVAPPAVGPNFVDSDGDGICDNCAGGGQGQAKGRGQAKKADKGRSGYGPGDGAGNDGVGPRDGSGFGPGGGSGSCDGTGPKGQSKRPGRRGGRR